MPATVHTLRKRGRGRPPMGDASKSATLSFRTTRQFKARIEAASVESGRSFSAECETAVERGFFVEDLKAMIRAELRQIIREELARD